MARFDVGSHETLGSGFGDDEAHRLLCKLCQKLIDGTTRLVATLLSVGREVRLPKLT